MLAASAAPAVEPAEEFVAGLRERGLDELTLDYLSRMETSRLADEQFKRRIPYHRGVTLIALSRETVDPDARSKLLGEARAELNRFAAENPQSISAAEANVQLASVLVEQAKQRMARAEQLPGDAALDGERERYHAQARGLLDEARELFRQAEESYSAELKRLSDKLGVAEDDSPPDQRQEYRGRLAQVRVLAAQTQFDKAQTYPADSASFRRLNEQTAEELGALYEAYSRWLVGLYAHLYEGRCYQALGDYQQALGCYEQLISQQSVLPEFRKLISLAYRYQAECFLDQGQYSAAIESCSAWLKDARATEAERPEWQAVRFRLAEALQLQAATLKEGSAEQRKLSAEAGDAYRQVAKSPSEFQAAARTAAVQLAPKNGRNGKLSDAPRDFMTAYEAGKAAIASANAARIALPSAQRNSPSAVAELHDQIERGTDDARRYFRVASTLVEDDTDPDLVNEVRYFLCWLYWENGDYYRAAVLGEFLARRYPDHSTAAAAAKLAMASYERMYRQAVEAGPETAGPVKEVAEFEARRMAQMAEYITRRWPGTPDADAAYSVLVTYAIRNDRIAEAEQLLAEASRRYRPQLELQLGNAMWGRYLELEQQKGNSRPDEAALGRMKREAVARLQSGFESVRKSSTNSETSATAALYLAQAMLSDGKYQQAIRLLEDRQHGPLGLAKRSDPSASRPGYAAEVYKAALRAYVSVSPPQASKALQTMEALEETIAGADDRSADELTRVYLGLGVALEQQIGQLRDKGRDREAAQVTEAFVQFLDQLRSRQQGGHWGGRHWVAQMFYQLGEDAAASTTARQYYTKARDAYRRMLTEADEGSLRPPNDEALLVARKQLGDCLQQLGEYRESLDVYSAVLKERESWLAVQYAAAHTYQQRGEAGDPKWLERAIYGGYRLRSTGKNRVWGWLRLAQVANRAARSDPKYRDMFFEARLNAARCRYLVGMKSEGPERAQHLATAQQNIRSMVQLYPDLGGRQWKRKYDQLLKEIQKAAGREPVGLRELAATR